MWRRPLLSDPRRRRSSGTEDFGMEPTLWHAPGQKTPRQLLQERGRAAQVEIGLPCYAKAGQYIDIQMSASIEVMAWRFRCCRPTVDDVSATPWKQPQK